MTNILNNRLSWDGSHLGDHHGTRIIYKWEVQGSTYTGIYLPEGWCNKIGAGNIYCVAMQSKGLFPCIVEDIKELFGIPRRGIHRITIGNQEYILYYVPISHRGEVIWETPLNRLDAKHGLRSNPKFRRDVQKLIAFCDILSLCGTGEPSIRIRPGINGQYIPINTNVKTTLISSPKGINYDYSIITKTLFCKWFGETTSIHDVVKEMVHYQSGRSMSNIPIAQSGNGNFDNLALISVGMRSKIDSIIRRYDGNYIWYSNFIVDRMSRHLLVDS